jgi:CHASE2 domain-containing sensor protein/tRNA A-37 threonylcarbamoyl transferase component Bud32
MRTRKVSINNSKLSKFIDDKYFLLLTVSFAVSSLVFGVRYFGGLKDGELSLYDRLVQLQAHEPPDPRILIVGIEEKDITSLGKNDLVLSKLINKLDGYQPQSIGLDTFRDVPQEPGNIELTADLQANNKIVTICEHPSGRKNSSPFGIAPPPNVPESRVGFADFATDDRDIVRRNLLSMDIPAGSKCRAGLSFGLVLALNYLSNQGIKLPDRSQNNNDLQIGTTIFKPIESNFGGYQNLGKNANGYQILLRYRFPKVAEQVTMSQVLNGEVKPDRVKDRIVLIGYAEDNKDLFYTPYNFGTSPETIETMPGVVIHAQMISQILSTVMDGRPQIWVWNLGGEFLWIWGWTTSGAFLFRLSRNSRKLSILLASAVTSAVIVTIAISASYILFTFFSGWIPLLPTLISSIAAMVILACSDYIQANDTIKNKLVGKGYKLEIGTDGQPIVLGEGGFKTVYKARNLDLPNQPFCVVKVIKLDNINVSEIDTERLQLAQQLFEKEAKILQGLRHDRIPQLQSFLCKNKEFYLVEDFIEGQTLDNLLNSHWRSEDRIISLLMDVLDVLKYIHSQNVIHADIKPSNLMLKKSDEKLFLIDFGAGKIFKVSNETTIVARKPQSQPNTVRYTPSYSPPTQEIPEEICLFTPGYAPPEQELHGQVYHNSDIYSIGIVAIQALTNIEPTKFERDDNNEIIWRDAAKVREDLAAILDRMVKPQSVDRYQSAQEVIDSLSILKK